jgi:hypothetical protein
MHCRIFNFAAIAAMCAMPIVTNAEDPTLGQRVDKAVEGVGNAVTGDSDVRNDAAAAPALPGGIERVENDDVRDVRTSLVAIVNRVLADDGLDDAVDYLANQDRDRIDSQLDDDKYEESFNKLAAQVREAFRTRYGEEFELTAGALDAVTAVQQGEVKDAQAARANWPLPAMTGDRDAAQAASNRPANDDPKLENGRDVAVVALHGVKDTAPLALSLQHELPDSWVLDVPNDVTADRVLASQTRTLQSLIDAKDQWPRTKEEGYRAIAHAVLKGFVDATPGAPVANTPRD